MNDEQFYNPEWETVNANTQRMRLPGYWLIRTQEVIIIRDSEVHVSVALVEFPDPDHRWLLKRK